MYLVCLLVFFNFKKYKIIIYLGFIKKPSYLNDKKVFFVDNSLEISNIFTPRHFELTMILYFI